MSVMSASNVSGPHPDILAEIERLNEKVGV